MVFNIAELTKRDPDTLAQKPWGEFLSICQLGLNMVKKKKAKNKK